MRNIYKFSLGAAFAVLSAFNSFSLVIEPGPGNARNPVDPIEEGADFSSCGIFYKIIDQEQKHVSTVEGDVPYSGIITIPDEVVFGNDTYRVTKVSGFLNSPDVEEITIPRYVTHITGFYGAYQSYSDVPFIKAPQKKEGEGNSPSPQSRLRTLRFNAINCQEAYYDHYASSGFGASIGGSQSVFPPSLTEVIIGEEVENIPRMMLNNCSLLTELIFPESVKDIDIDIIDEEFDNLEKCVLLCRDLRTLHWLPNNLSAITLGEEFHTFPYSRGKAAGASSSHKYFSTKSDVFSNFMGYDVETTELELPEWVWKIADDAFNSYRNLTSLKLNNSVAEIGEEAFANSPIYHLSIDKTGNGDELAIGDYAFRNTQFLTLTGAHVKLGNYSFGGTTGVELNCDSISFGSETFRSEVFSHTENCLWNVKKGTDAPTFLFTGRLKTLTIGPNVEIISPSLFEETQISELVLPEGVKTIGEYAFFNCRYLNSVEVPASVTDMQWYSFGKSGLMQATLHCSDANFDAFRECTSLSKIIIGDEVKTVNGYLDYSQVKSLHFPKNVAGRFYHDGLTSISFGEDVTEVPEWFAADSPLESIVFEGKVKRLGNYCFRESRLKSIVYPESLEEVFSTSYGLEEVVELEYNCRHLDNILSLYLVKSEKLKKITIGEEVEAPPYIEIPPYGVTLHYNAIKSYSPFTSETQTYLENIVFGEKVKVIPGYILRHNKKISSVTLPASVNEVGDDAFAGCDALMRVISAAIVPPEMTGVASTTFSELTYATATLCVPKGAAERYKDAMGWKNFFNVIELEELGSVPGGETGIDGISADKISDATDCYNLNGQRIMNPTPGIYIIDGRKVILR